MGTFFLEPVSFDAMDNDFLSNHSELRDAMIRFNYADSHDIDRIVLSEEGHPYLISVKRHKYEVQEVMVRETIGLKARNRKIVSLVVKLDEEGSPDFIWNSE